MVRVRFAPSPTGPLHIGGIRTAIYNYLFAKRHKGSLILRIEDTDANRLVKNSEKHILDSLSWCGVEVDESIIKKGAYGPYRQSERKNIYLKNVKTLLDCGKAYYAFDTAEELERQREECKNRKETFTYNHNNRLSLKNSLSLDKQSTNKLLETEPYVIRFKNTSSESIKIQDMIRGDIIFDTSLLDDKILIKSDGLPTYHLANVIDDHLMNITHIIRGEEWLPSAALHQSLYNAFGWEAPKFAHLPLILKPTGNGKLSKRDSDKMGIPIFAVSFFDEKENKTYTSYKELGYLPEALINFLINMSLNTHDDKDLYDINSLIDEFDIKQINNSGAKFDIEKLRWYNHQYIQKTSNATLTKKYIKLLKNNNIKITVEKASKIVSATKERAVLVNDFLELGHYLINSPKTYNEKSLKKCKNEESKIWLEYFIKLAEEHKSNLKEATQILIKEKEIPTGKFMQNLRISLTGDLKGIDLFEIIKIIGVKETINRVKKFIDN